MQDEKKNSCNEADEAIEAAEEVIQICTACGKENRFPTAAKFCTHCGNKF